MTHRQPRQLTTFLIVLLVLAAFLVGYQARSGRPLWAALATPGSLRQSLDDTISLKPVQLYQEALARVQMNFVDPVTNPQELTYAAIRGMLVELGDPYTRFMDPKEFKEFNSDTKGSFAGIGATLNMTEIPAAVAKEHEDGTVAPVQCPVCGTVITDIKHYRVTIVEPMPGSPAKEAGLQPGDFILKVDDTVTDGLTVAEVADKIRGPEGTKVVLSIARKGIEKPLNISLTRSHIEVPAVETKMLDDNIGYLRIFSFNEKTVPESRAALLDFNKKKVSGVVIDLRNNPGGLLRECVRLSSFLLPEDNKLIVSTQGRGGEKEAYERVGDQIYNLPLVVLVNKGSASASEILSGALKDYKRATIVGESTYGKASVQTVQMLSDGSAMAITTAHYFTPSGADISKKGVHPDVMVELDKDVRTLTEKDNQAQAAVRILKDVIAKKQ